MYLTVLEVSMNSKFKIQKARSMRASPDWHARQPKRQVTRRASRLQDEGWFEACITLVLAIIATISVLTAAWRLASLFHGGAL
jgi:hypothetical protein